VSDDWFDFTECLEQNYRVDEQVQHRFGGLFRKWMELGLIGDLPPKRLVWELIAPPASLRFLYLHGQATDAERHIDYFLACVLREAGQKIYRSGRRKIEQSTDILNTIRETCQNRLRLMKTPIKADVIIIGAGPTGLSLACQLIRYGVDFVIVDKNEGITRYSKAIGVQARTLEIYEQLGLAQQAVEQGTITEKVCIVEGGEVRGEVELANIGKGLSPYPYLLVFEQSKHEQMLYNFIQHHGKEVWWQTTLESFSQDDGGVTAQIKNADGETQTIEAKFIVGCDGAKSLVRHTLGLTFEGSTFERLFYVADVQIDWQFSHDAAHICLAQNTLTAFFPMPGENRYRIVGTFPSNSDKEEGEILYEEIEQQIIEDTKLKLDITKVNWFSVYKVHTRRVNKFSEGRGFVAGDAAHIHSPAGGQGMNTGIQDGYNLAWKLAFVLRGKAGARILETYNEERLENAKHLVETTDRIFEFGASDERFVAYFRTHIFPHIANFVLHFDTVKKFIFPLISQIGIHYRDGSLSKHEGDKDFAVKAGERMPYFVTDGVSVYDKLHQPKFHLLVFSDGHHDYQALRTELENEDTVLVDFNIIPLQPHVAKLFRTDQPFSMLLRPDNYIGFISPEASVDALRIYLSQFVGGS
jgi:2-polyprenyl-6-methoxyphenol hydroxylase-like FAD-dependent oxidoreductase